MINALSIDVEEWYHAELIRPTVESYEKISQVNDAITPILSLLDRYNTKATFFILGEVIETNPNLVKDIYFKGHEIASHGISHRSLWEIGKDAFSQQLDKFSNLIKDAIGERIHIKGYRAPNFSLDNSTKWAVEVLREKGYAYDSSIFPIKNKLYGLNEAPLKIYRPSLIDLRKEDPYYGLLEFPLAVHKMLGLRIPVAGGFYFRVMPLFILKRFLRKINRDRPFVFYLHPWETYSCTPRVKGLSPVSYFITYWGIQKVLRKLESLLKDFTFKPICEVLGV